MTRLDDLHRQDELSRLVLKRWRRSPRAFCRQALHIDPWAKQAEILTSVRDHERTAVKSCHKAGKSTTCAMLALWFLACFYRSRVILTAPTHRQVRSVLWREVVRLYKRANEANPWLFGSAIPHTSAEAGLQYDDGREIIGFATPDAERMAGFSGPRQLFIGDEATGIPDPIHEAIDGNRAGGARVLMTSNPTRLSGVFYEAFQPNSGWNCISISAYDVPSNIPGLTRKAWAEQKAIEWRGDARYQVRVLGNFPTEGDEGIFPTWLLNKAEANRPYDPEAKHGKTLQIGVDVARYGEDETVLAVRDGNTIFFLVFQQLDANQIVTEILQIAGKIRKFPQQMVSVHVDANGVGAGVCDAIKRHLGSSLALVEVMGASHSYDKKAHANAKTGCLFALQYWLENGGHLDLDDRTRAEFRAYGYTYDVKGRLLAFSKDAMRAVLHASPDRADAASLAVPYPDVLDHEDDSSRLELERLLRSNGPAKGGIFASLSDDEDHDDDD